MHNRTLRNVFISIVISVWFIVGWPPIWQNPRIPSQVQKAYADNSTAVSYVGASNLIATNGGAPGAITPHSSTVNGDLLVFFHYSRAAGGDETVTLPSGFTSVFNSVTASQGLVAVGYRIRQSGDTTHTASITNHTSSSTGETVLEWIETYRGFDTSSPIVNYTASLSTWASSLNIGPISAPDTATVRDGDMAIVFGGRFENITGQTTLNSDDGLMWGAHTFNNSSLGTDAGAITQSGLNLSGSDKTVTAKTITTIGTTQTGAGRMFIIQREGARTSEAVSYIGTSTLLAANGAVPGAITPHSNTADGDLLVFFHYSRAAGGDETVTLPSGFTSVFNSVTAAQGLVAVGYRIKQSGDTTFTASVTNHSSGETVLEWIESYHGVDSSNPIVNYTASLSTWASSLNIGSISAPDTATVRDGDMVVVFGGRFENVTGQTTIDGSDGLMWGAHNFNNSSLGSDAGAVTQSGLNLSGSDKTVTAKTITSIGTPQAGAGRMFIIQRASSGTVSISIASDATISYGNVSTNKSTLDLSDTQIAENDGDTTADFNIKTSNATGGTTWTVGTSAGSDIYVHEFSVNAGGAWEVLNTADSYETLKTGVGVGSTQPFDMRITVPTSTSDYQQKTITITVQAVQP